jgi:hypothetical protein
MWLELLKSKAIEQRCLMPDDEIDAEKAFLLVRDMPYSRTSSYDPAITISEWKGTCSGKHQLLKKIFSELGLPSRLIACTTVTILDPKKVIGKLRKLLVQSKGRIVDVHNYLILDLPKGAMIVDATWPSSTRGMHTVINEHFVLGENQKIAAKPLISWVVPENRDIHEFKNEILSVSFSQEELNHREEFVKTVSKMTNSKLIKFLVWLGRIFKDVGA